MMCFAPDCKHYSEKHLCKFFTFPKDEKEKRRWIKLIRRAGKEPSSSSRICSCHFKDGVKKNGPTLFEHNATRRFDFDALPDKKKPRKIGKKAPLFEVSDAQKENVPPQENVMAVEVVAVVHPTTSQSSTSSVLTEAENMLLQKEVAMLNKKCEKLSNSFSFAHIENDDELVVLYTGLPNKFIFDSLFDLLKNIEKTYYSGWNVECISAKDQLFLTLYKLRQNPPHKDLARQFCCSAQSITNTFLTWLHLLHEIIFCQLMASVPSRTNNQACLPNCFSLFPNTRMVIDCTEIFSEIPHSLDKKRVMYSHYKHRNTLKALIGVAPNGVVTYLSPLYPGSTSDKKIVEHCGVLNIFDAGDLIIADKGFLIGDILPAGVSLNIPPFLWQPQFTANQIKLTRNIARARIHVERAIRRCKAYRILNLIPQNYISVSTIIWQVCGALTNFQYPLIKEVEIYYKDESLST